MSDTFCIFPWKYLAIGPEGSARICCVTHKRISADGVPMSVHHNTVEEIWNSDYMRDLRRAMVSGEYVPDCEVCYRAEAGYGHSYRTSKTPGMLDRPVEDIKSESVDSDFIQSSPPSHIKLEVGNLCNLKCRMCGSSTSSQIDRDLVHNKWAPRNDYELSFLAEWNDNLTTVGPFPIVGVRTEGFGETEERNGCRYRWTTGRSTIDLPLDPSASIEGVEIEFNEAGHQGQEFRVGVNGQTLYEGRANMHALTVCLDISHLSLGAELEVEIEAKPVPIHRQTPTMDPADDVAEYRVPPRLAVEAIRLRRRPGRLGADGDVVNSRFAGPGGWFDQDSFVFNEILADLAKIEEIYFTGGEPFLISRVEDIVDHLIKSGHADHITLEFSTNCTKADPLFLEKLSRFRRVNLFFSLDGVGEVYDYIRFPARWVKVRKNIDALMSLPNGGFMTVPVIQAYNVLNIVDICRFCDQAGIAFSLENVLMYPEHLRVSLLPETARKLAADRLRAYARTDCLDTNRDMILSMAAYFENLEDDCAPDAMHKFMLFTNDLDVSRGQSFRDSHRELFDLITESGFSWSEETLFARAGRDTETSVATLPTSASSAENSISIIVPTYRRADGLRSLLTSLRPQVIKAPDCSVVVVNDGSHDDEYQGVIDEFEDIVDYLPLSENRGPAAARNTGASRATGRFLAFVDDDCMPPDHWLDWLLAIIESDPGVAVVGGSTRLDPSPTSSPIAVYNRAFGFHPRPLYQAGELYCLPSANLAVRRDWFDKIGGFDERFLYAAGEDVNLAYRLKIAGATFHIDESWYIEHEAEDNLRGFWRRWYRYGYGNAQHLCLTDDTADFGIYRDKTFSSILRDIPRGVRQQKAIYDRELNVDWADVSQEKWQPIAFRLLGALQPLAYRLGARRGFCALR
jgi:glutamate-1-semialdehyde 2,1-aminomutase